jgi:class 3 adenylate cyclase
MAEVRVAAGGRRSRLRSEPVDVQDAPVVIAPEVRYAQTVDGADIAYVVLGEGPPDLVWVPAWVSHLDFMWEGPFAHTQGRLLERLATFARVATFDKRGTGLSSRMSAAAGVEVWVDDLHAVLDAVGMDRPAIFGAGAAGCAIGVLQAAGHPTTTGALVLFGPSARTVTSPDYPWGLTDEEIARGQAGILESWGTEAWVREFAAVDWASAVADPEFVRYAARWLRNAATPSDAALMDRIWSQIDVRALLPAVSVPTLVLARTGWTGSAGDSRYVLEESRYLAGRSRRVSSVAQGIPGAAYVELPGADFPPWLGDIEAVVAEVQAFLTGTRPVVDHDRLLATVLFTDIVGSTERAAALGDHAWRDLLERHHETVRLHLGRYRGREVDTAGDGFFATFDGPARAVRCAQAVAEAVRPLGIEVRAGLHTGEVETIDRKAGGIAVTIGSRVCALAGPSEVLVSSTVKDLVAGSGLAFEDAGERELKGVPDRWRLYRVVG